MHNLGQTRSSRQRDHLLHTPDTFVRSPLPGLTRGNAIVHISPAVGAAFTQYTVELEPGGSMEPASAQRFVYVLEGEMELSGESARYSLAPGGYAYLPLHSTYLLTAKSLARITVIEKPYGALEQMPAPEMIVGKEAEIQPTALNGDADLEVRALLPGTLDFDFAVNTMTYQPGAALSQVEVHVMEHGLLMLEGGGIYRLGDAWYPVTAGDFIWMAPFCPQWFGALGKQPAKYLIYKDWNRHPLGFAIAAPR